MDTFIFSQTRTKNHLLIQNRPAIAVVVFSKSRLFSISSVKYVLLMFLFIHSCKWYSKNFRTVQRSFLCFMLNIEKSFEQTFQRQWFLIGLVYLPVKDPISSCYYKNSEFISQKHLQDLEIQTCTLGYFLLICVFLNFQIRRTVWFEYMYESQN